jgi:hypothetical protein
MTLQFKSGLFALVTLGWTSFCLGQSPHEMPVPGPTNSPEQLGTASSGEQLPSQRASGSISGTVVDQSGAVIAGAQVKLTRTSEDQSLNQEVLSGGDGQFSFANIAPGPFQLTVTSAGFESHTSSGILRSRENDVVPQIALAVATSISEIEVGLSRTEVAEEEVKVEEKQRVLGVLPNVYVSYLPNAVPLNSKQKFNLA